MIDRSNSYFLTSPLDGLLDFRIDRFSWFSSDGAIAHVLEDVNFEVVQGSCTTIVGASGSGKTTLLNLLSSCLRGDVGDTQFRESSVVLHHQNARLMPWLTIRENLLLEKRLDDEGVWEDICAKLELNSILARFPHQVSGGQRERTALGRSLLRQPDILLLDEPLAGTDHFLRLQIEDFFSDIVEKTGRTIVVVTHDLTEAIAISDRIIYLSGADGVFTTGIIEIPDSVKKSRPSEVRQMSEFPRLMTTLTNALGGI